jgi:hypothetical protein
VTAPEHSDLTPEPTRRAVGRFLSVLALITLLGLLIALAIAVEHQKALARRSAPSGPDGRPPGAAFRFTSPPVFKDTPQGLTVQWATSLPASYRITYGRDDAYEISGPADSERRERHSVSLGSVQFPELYRWALVSVSARGDMLVTEIVSTASEPVVPLRLVKGAEYAPLLEPENLGTASAWCDYDLDGDPDLFLCGGPGNTRRKGLLLRNEPGRFKDVTESIRPSVETFWALSASWGDFTADGFPDLLLLGQTLRVFVNSGPPDFAFSDGGKLLDFGYGGLLRSGTFCDADNDGLPDIALLKAYHGLVLYRNMGRGLPRFEDASTQLRLLGGKIGSNYYLKSFVPADFDRDGRTDLLFNTPGLALFRRQAGGLRFSRVKRPIPGKVKPGAPFPAVAVDDINADGCPDLFAPPFELRTGVCDPELLLSTPSGDLQAQADVAGELAGFRLPSNCAVFADLNLDGIADLVVGTVSTGLQVFMGSADERWTDVTIPLVPTAARTGNVKGLVAVDYDGDGRVDIFAVRYQLPNILLQNQLDLPSDKAVLGVDLRANRGITNATVELYAPDGKLIAARQVLGTLGGGSQAPGRLHFIVPPGRAKLRVIWSDGSGDERLIEPAPGTFTVETIQRK